MQARLTAFVPDGAAITRSLTEGDVLRVGRGEDCELRLDHPSVSRLHARLVAAEAGAALTDLGSKNGSFVDGAQVQSAALDGSCWLRFGDVHCEFNLLDMAAAEADVQRWHERKRAATVYTMQFDSLAEVAAADAAAGESMLEACLLAVTELAGCSRGFLLLDECGSYRVRAALALNPVQMVEREFAGSRGTVKRAIEQRRTIVFNDVGQGLEPPGEFASIAQGGLRTLVCLPLLDGDRVLGAIYADRRAAGPPLTTLDLELLEAFADRAALWLSAHRASDDLATAGTLDWDRMLADVGDRPG